MLDVTAIGLRSREELIMKIDGGSKSICYHDSCNTKSAAGKEGYGSVKTGKSSP